ncbi:MAG: hypothetical protein U1A23_04765 [Candidatus Sungbacteria bacterium]|nr:hypothetical protein [bacterium]MDZ4286216.1 hypothetical protein [Candidatus Sungbacteria bacterium]
MERISIMRTHRAGFGSVVIMLIIAGIVALGIGGYVSVSRLPDIAPEDGEKNVPTATKDVGRTVSETPHISAIPSVLSSPSVLPVPIKSHLPISTPPPSSGDAHESLAPQSNGSSSGSVRSGWSPLYTELSGCQKKTVTFTSPPMAMEAMIAVEPQGELTDIISGHITPGDHIGIKYPSAKEYDVYAMGEATLKRVERNKNLYIESGGDEKNYHLYFEYSCSLFGSYVHVTKLAPELLAADAGLRALDALPEITNTTERNIYVRIPVRAGQVIGKAKAYGLLGILTVDTDMRLRFVNPLQYEGEPWKVHAVPPFAYFSPSVREALMAKNPRIKEPRGGKIDFDIAGRLSGNWFRKGTTGFSSQPSQAYCGAFLCPYWDGHLAFVYDFVDPDQVRISIGYDMGISTRGPYGVRKNTPNPADISPASGLVRYELVSLENRDADFGLTTQGPPLVTRYTDNVLGTLLVQMRDESTLTMEVFPQGVSAAVFTDKARTYTR